MPAILVFLAALGLSVSSNAPAVKPPIQIPSAVLSADWTGIQLPDTPLFITAEGNDFWVTGENEMIAVSHDGGQNWTVLHQRKNGEMLFSLVFLSPQRVEAFGSAGTRVESKNGGASWRDITMRPDISIAQVSAPQNDILFGTTIDWFGSSHDGGATWSMVRYTPKSAGTDAPVITQAVAISPSQALMVVGPGTGDRGAPAAPCSILSTNDGGKKWSVLRFGSFACAGSATQDDQFVLYGTLMDQTGIARPAAEVSADGMHWRTAAAPLAQYHTCNLQGCLAGSGWVDLRGPQPIYWRLPSQTPFIAAWANVGTSFCAVGEKLSCLEARKPSELPEPSPPTPLDPSRGEAQVMPSLCRNCPAPHYPESDRMAHRQGTVRLHVIIQQNGRVGSIELLAAGSRAMASSVISAVQNWTYVPFTLNGKPQEVDSVITVHFTLGD